MTFLSFIRSSRILPYVIFTGLLIIACSSTAQAIEQGGVGGRPAYPKADNARSQSIFVHRLHPGDNSKDGVEVINNSAEIKQVHVYAVDSQVSSGGAFACAQATEEPLSVGKWIAVSKKELTLRPGSKQVVDFEIAVPASTSPGEHNGCIVIQDTKQQASPDNNGIVLTMRSAIRVAITVPGDITKGLIFTGIAATHKSDNTMLLSAALKNNGNVSLDTLLDIKLVYPFGIDAVKAGGNFPVLNSTEGRFNFEASRPFWGGWLQLVATAHYNNNPAVSLGEGRATTAITDSRWIYITPHPIALIIELGVLLFLATAVTLFMRRKLADKRATRTGRTHTVSSGEDLHSIAGTYHMSWKQLARLNKLKPPYQLKPGQKLRVTSHQTQKHPARPTRP